jgi:hypothetical protein
MSWLWAVGSRQAVEKVKPFVAQRVLLFKTLIFKILIHDI